jgi:transcriptional regulator with XRE-family HTH domain
MVDKDAQGKRLEMYVRKIFKNQTAFAKVYGVGQSTVSKIINGSSGITLELIDFIQKRNSDFNIRWLLYGEGEMFLEKIEPTYEAEIAGEASKVGEPEGAYEEGLVAKFLRIMEELEAEVEGLRASVEVDMPLLRAQVEELKSELEALKKKQ